MKQNLTTEDEIKYKVECIRLCNSMQGVLRDNETPPEILKIYGFKVLEILDRIFDMDTYQLRLGLNSEDNDIKLLTYGLIINKVFNKFIK